MNKQQKQAFVKGFNAKLAEANTVVVGHYRGLTVPEFEGLRNDLRQNESTVEVVKNRLVKLAVQGTDYTNLEEFLSGPTAIAMSSDPVSAAKVAQKFADNNDNFVILGGAMGTEKLDAAGVKSLASMPSLDELRAKLIGLLQAPATKIAVLAKEPGSMVARVCAAKGAQA